MDVYVNVCRSDYKEETENSSERSFSLFLFLVFLFVFFVFCFLFSVFFFFTKRILAKVFSRAYHDSRSAVNEIVAC